MVSDNPLDRLFRAWCAPDLVLHGFRARPLCLGHIILLHALQSPFAEPGADVEVSPSDVVLFLAVCESAHWPFREISLPDAARSDAAVEALCDREKLQDSVDAITRWIAECGAGPQLWQSDKPGDPLSAPWFVAFALRLIRSGFPEERAWSMPLGLVRWYCSAAAELDGADIRFVTAEDAAINAAVKRLEEEGPDVPGLN